MQIALSSSMDILNRQGGSTADAHIQDLIWNIPQQCHERI
jgi:hypothetical protein